MSSNRKPLPVEFRVGASIGRNYWWTTSVPSPLAKLSISPDCIVVELSGHKYRFPKSSIEEIGNYAVAGVDFGLRIRHSYAGSPPYVVFGTPFGKNDQPIIRALQTYGYPTDT